MLARMLREFVPLGLGLWTFAFVFGIDGVAACGLPSNCGFVEVGWTVSCVNVLGLGFVIGWLETLGVWGAVSEFVGLVYGLVIYLWSVYGWFLS